MREDQFPHAGVGPTSMHPELFIHEQDFLNYHINHDKWFWFALNFDLWFSCRLVDDFLFEEIDASTENISAGGSIACSQTLPHGVLVFTTNAADDNYAEVYWDNLAWRLYEKCPLYFETRFKVDETEQSDVVLGLVDDAGYFADAPDDGVYFLKNDGSESLTICVEDTGTVTAVDTGVDLVDLTWYRVGFHWDGDATIRWFVWSDAGACLAQGDITAGFPQDVLLRPVLGIQSGQAQTAKVLYVDYLKLTQRRYVA